jgi:hypothetical protein
MSLFPAFPTNGQTTTVNGTLYTYNSAQTAWIRTNATVINGLVVTGNISVSGSLTSGNLADAMGYKGIPQNVRTSQYTLALSDIGFHISITTGGVIIPANSSVAFPIGSTVVVYNNSTSTQTISITTDTLRQAGTTTSTTGVILNPYGLATLIKVASTVWVVSGNVVSLPLANYLIVAGGGGSGTGNFGGGGGGGVLSGSAPIFIASYAITVGQAGAYGTPTNGGDSSALGQTAIGGGAGGNTGVNGSAGGSGGGGGSSGPVTSGGAGTSGQGFAGGAGTSGSPAGCGGGAGGVGGTGSGGNGGPAISSSITGSPVNYGGGGRGANSGSTAVSAYGEGAGGNVGIGKAGVVIIAYPTGSMTATGGTITTSGGNTIHTFTSNGTFQRTA